MSFAESVPVLAAKARSRLGVEAANARSVGQFVVDQVREKLASSPAPRVMSSISERITRMDLTPVRSGGRGERPAGPSARRHSPAPSGQVPSAGWEGGRRASPTAAQLPIPSYDSLSASQVTQRLAGLSREEIATVRAYEVSTRARATVLAKADQLLKG
jgi:hypothetical protein